MSQSGQTLVFKCRAVCIQTDVFLLLSTVSSPPLKDSFAPGRTCSMCPQVFGASLPSVPLKEAQRWPLGRCCTESKYYTQKPCLSLLSNCPWLWCSLSRHHSPTFEVQMSFQISSHLQQVEELQVTHAFLRSWKLLVFSCKFLTPPNTALITHKCTA